MSKSGYYHFKIFGIKPNLVPVITELRTIRLRINGAVVYSENQGVYLPKGWHNFNLQLIFPLDLERANISESLAYDLHRIFRDYREMPNLSDFLLLEDLNVKSRRTEDKSFTTVELWRDHD